MNKRKLILLMSLVTVVVMAIVLSLSTAGIAKLNNAKSLKLKLKKPDITDLVFVAVNNWNYVMRNNGSYMYDSPDADNNGNNAGGEFPRGSANTIVYAGGLYIGTLKNGVEVVSETEFSTEYQPGPITNSGVPFAELVADNPLSATNQVYFIDRSLGNEDAANWPDAAPKDFLGQPAIIADGQTWGVFNDLDVELSSESQVESPFPGLGMEVEIESFAFNAGPLSDVAYIKLTITNKTSTNYSDSYLGAWMDADVGGNSGNDIVGVDTVRGLGYVYNNTSEAPLDFATGFDFFQGPVVDADSVSVALAAKFAGNTTVLVYDPVSNLYKTTALPAGKIWLGATAFNTYANGTDPIDNRERYNLLAGRDKSSGIAKVGCGLDDYYAFRGNPITQQGTCDVAGSNNPRGGTFATAADQRILHGVGPFTIKAGETQEIWLGIIGAGGVDRFAAVANMWTTDDIAQTTFNAGLIAPTAPPSPKISVAALDGQAVISWQNNAETTFDIAGRILGINTANGYSADYDSTDFQGYRVYRSRTGLPGSFTMLAQYDLVDGLTTVVNRTVNAAGKLVIDELELGTDNGIKYTYTDNTVTNGQVYYYSVTAYDAQPYIATSGYVQLAGTELMRSAHGAAVSLINLSFSLGAFRDSVVMANASGYRAGPAPGIWDDTLIIGAGSYNATHYTVFDVLYFYEYGPQLPAVGSQTVIHKTHIYFPNFDDFSDVDVTFTTDNESETPVTIQKPSGLPISLESAQSGNVVSCVPSAPIASKSFDASIGSLSHPTGGSDGYVAVEVVDPEKVTGHSYRLEFFLMPRTISGDTLKGVTVDQVGYKVFDVTANAYMKFVSRSDDPRTFLDRNNDGVFNGADSLFDESYFATRVAQFDADVSDEDFAIGDGILWKIYGPASYFKSVTYLPGTQYSAAGVTSTWWKGFSGRNFADQEYESLGIGSPANGMTAYTYVNFGSPVQGSGGDSYNRDVKIVFSRDSTKWQYSYSTSGGSGGNTRYVRVPFQVFEIDAADGNATPRQVNTRTRERNLVGSNLQCWGLFNGGFVPITVDPLSDGTGPQTRGFIFVDTTSYDLGSKTGHYGSTVAGDKLFAAADYFSSPSYAVWTPTMRDLDLTANPGLTDGNDWNEFMQATIGAATSVAAGIQGHIYRQIPDEGTLEMKVNHPYTGEDTYTFSTTANTTLSKAAVKKNMDNIKVVPNPYYGRSTYQASLFDKQVKFTNLPGTCTIKIFTVSGDLVHTLNHNSTSNNDRLDVNPLSQTLDPAAKETSVEIWNLQNTAGKYVASGMYVALIDAKGVGKKLVKFAVIQEEVQINGPDIR